MFSCHRLQLQSQENENLSLRAGISQGATQHLTSGHHVPARAVPEVISSTQQGQNPGTGKHRRQMEPSSTPANGNGQREIPNFIVFTLYDRNNSAHWGFTTVKSFLTLVAKVSLQQISAQGTWWPLT